MDWPDSNLLDALVKAQMSAIALVARDHAPLSISQASAIICNAVWDEMHRVLVIGDDDADPSRFEGHLTAHAIRCVREAQAGLARREVLIDRIVGLPRDQQIAYSLRYEHGMSDAQIATIMGKTEAEIIALMLGALERINGRSDTDH